MRKFTKLMLTFALLVGVMGGANSVKAKTLDVDLSKLPASQGTATWDSETKTFAWTGTWSNALDLPGIKSNMSDYTGVTWSATKGTMDHFRILLYFTNGAGQITYNPGNPGGGKTPMDMTGEHSVTFEEMGVVAANMAFIDKICISGANDGTGDIIINSFSFTGPDVTPIEASKVYEAPAGTTDLNGMIGYDSNKWSISYPKEVSPQGEFAVGNLNADNKSVDISSYDYFHLVVTSVDAGKKLSMRVFTSEENSSDNEKRHCIYARPIADAANPETNWEEIYYISEPGIYVAKISGYPLLRGVKGGNGFGGDESNGKITVSQSYLCSGAPVSYKETGKYIIVGKDNTGAASLTAALADASATFYDATGITGTGVDLTSVANKNALFKANADVLTNTNNVIVSGTCANLELTDGQPFKAPATFTATAAKFTKTVSDAGYATMVIPFAVATLPEGVEAYNLTGVTGESITYSTAATIAADKPVLIKATEGTYNFEASGVAVAATADGVVTNGLLNGTYATTTAAAGANNYVLQKNDDDVNFYLVKGTDATVKPFRAYLKASGAGARALNIDLGETTGIETVKKADVTTAVYSLSGQRVAAPQKGLYIVNGKKVIVK